MRWLREAAITVCGLIALISPVVLWTAWSTTVFYAVLAAGCGAILIIYLLVTWSPDEDR
jgi:peptidoglycan/LPS O-acetylase OafA/YrhL